jgi:hypothetical protein
MPFNRKYRTPQFYEQKVGLLERPIRKFFTKACHDQPTTQC